MLPSFPSLREKNLRTLYGSANNDRSPKGSVDEKIIPLVDLINRHPEYVTLSSCSGRVALFDPAGSNYNDTSNDDDVQIVKGTEISGKGRGKWIYVKHDIEPNLGQSIIHSLKQVGKERLHARHRLNSSTTTTNENNNHDNNFEPPITFKHEPPLLHVGAASLHAGKKLLHIAKSICAMRESGLVVTDQRVTVELRTTGTLLCLPLMIQLLEEDESSSSSISLIPNEEYLQSLADMADERMVQNELLLKKLYNAIQDGLFENNPKSEDGESNITTKNNEHYNVTLQSLPPLNLWKTAAVAIPRNIGHHNSKNDMDLLAFGGQGIGPDLAQNNGKVPTCRRWDAVFRLSRQGGIWTDQWDTLQLMNNFDDSEGTKLSTSAGIFKVKLKQSIGAREGHSACVLPHLKSKHNSSNDVVAIFGGRAGPLSPSNDLFLFMMTKDEGNQELGLISKPSDIRGTLPEPRFGHTMSVLNNEKHLAVIAGGTGVDGNNSKTMSLSSVYILSLITNDESECCSHFIWDRIQDMPSPRSYHSTFIDEGSNSMFVFGGESDDPFGGSSDDTSNAFVIKLPHAYVDNEADIITNIVDHPPALIGSSAVSFSSKSRTSVLVVGGAKSPAYSDSENQDEQVPINFFTTRMHENGSTNEFVQAGISSFELLDADSNTVDLGSCVHHCLVALPGEQNKEFADTVIVGGGVPSLSFGQSYARYVSTFDYCTCLLPLLIFSLMCNHLLEHRSYVVNVTRAERSKEATAKTIEQDRHDNDKMPSKNAIVSDTQPVQEVSGKSMTKVNVVYVEAHQARVIKHELDQLGLFDKRYKLVKVDDNLIAIPITDQCTIRELIEAKDTDNNLKNMIVRVGNEMAPFSSSSMSKMKQRPR